ncbi:MAG: DNA replication/repair protein RecF [Candidatus Caldatribacteriota bacterium]|nr:DNA replication/repair protein RecF [Atribacterota bacterium]MDI9596451.1 DNA replication/repair protein RecF [Atribacterota bacterium]
MNVKKIRLINFRNILDLSVDFDNSLNIFIGNNAQGKTNLVESIFTLMKGKSYRTTNDENLINWNENKSYILGEVQKKEENYKISILLQNIGNDDKQTVKLKKVIKINKKYQRRDDLFKKFNPVIFTPEDLQIIKSTPLIRRKFLDEVIISINLVYNKYLRNYNRILYQRNTLLKSGKNINKIDKQLIIWDQKIIELGTIIILNRIKTLQKINKKAKIFHQMMTENKETIKLKYNSNVLEDYTDDKEEIYKIIENKLKESREKDFQLKMTTIGPHRDDYYIMNNTINLGVYGSQGQQRTAALSLKLAELELLKEQENEYPVLLLDDVMSELDPERRFFLLKLITERSVQTFITNIILDELKELEVVNNLKIFKIKNGMIEG